MMRISLKDIESFYSPQLWYFKKDTVDPADIMQQYTDSEEKESKKEPVIRCRFCNYKITEGEKRIAVNGSHHHTFANPSGLIYDVGCFSDAEGCVNMGIPTSEFTWFKGYLWRFSLCASCRSHLGWLYSSTGTGSFHGLILPHLIESE